MSLPTQTIKDSINSIISRLNLIEHQLNEFEKTRSECTIELQAIHVKIDKIKEDIREHRSIPDILSSISDVEKRLRGIELELPDFRLVKRVFLGFIAIILTAFIGALWNTVIQPPKKDNIDEIAKRIIQEYKRQDERK